MLADTHSHLSFKAFEKDLEEVLKRNRHVFCIDVGTKYETSEKAVKLAEDNENIYAAIGMHPIHIKTDLLKAKMDPEEGEFQPFLEEYNEKKYIDLAKSKKVVAIGEIGLDFYHKPKSKTKQEQFKQKQKEVFLKQLDLASKLNLPVILHCRMAHEEMLEILRKRNHKGVIHCFTGSLKQAEEYIRLGYYIGINGIIFKLDLSEVVLNVPLENMLLETDCPYLTPPEAGMERNEPRFVEYVARRVAEIKGIDALKVIERTTENAKKLFGV
ncbi:TatD family hydrolase [Patescibacteria group bacterium]|nr:TatD family hydrolase [Patescibacteria group bacterium]